jgi:hypothetical protein
MDDHDRRVRERAYRIWEDEGRPDGRAHAHWELASELVAIEENQKAATKPVRRDAHDPSIAADDVEPAAPAAAAVGDLPTLTDEGEQIYPPRKAEREVAGSRRR